MPDPAALMNVGAPSNGAMDVDQTRGRSRRRWGSIPSKTPDKPPQEEQPTNGEAAAPPTTDGTTTAADETKPAKRRRRSRWEDAPAEPEPNDERALMLMPEEIVLSNGIKVIMPAALTGRGDPEIVAFHKDLLDIDRKIKAGIIDIPPEGRRSPSPPPIYDHMGIRQNTREVRYKDKMMKTRNRLIEELIKRDPTFKPPADYKPEKKWRKIYIPYKEFPGYNFIGLIIGPRGNTQKRMQSETNTKIAIRGKGSVKEGIAKTDRYDAAQDDDLHVMITGDKQEEVDEAAAMVERLLQPLDEEMNQHKQKQLRELAALNGTLKEDNYCLICGEQGHTQLACPKKAIDVYRLPDAIQTQVEEQYARDIARMNPGEANNADQEYKSFLAELGGTDPRAGGSSHQASIPGGGGGGGMRDQIPDAAKLWIGNIPPSINDQALRQLFEPYGPIAWCTVKTDNGIPRGFGFVHYTEEGAAKAALEDMHGKLIDGRPLTVRPRTAPGEAPPPRERPSRAGLGAGGGPGGRPEDDLPPECKLFIGSIPNHVDEFVLRREFERFGSLVYVRVIVDRETQRPKGFGFVAYHDAGAAAAAVAGMDRFPGFDPMRPLAVKIAGDRSGGDRGGGGGFGGSGANRGPLGPPRYGGGGGGGHPPPPHYGGHHEHGGGGHYGGAHGGHQPPLPPPSSGYPPYPPQEAGGGYGGGGYPPMPPPPGAYGGYHDPYGGAYGAPAAADPYYGYYNAAQQYGAAPPPPGADGGAVEGQQPPLPPPPPSDGAGAPPPPPPPVDDPNAPPPPPPAGGYDYAAYYQYYGMDPNAGGGGYDYSAAVPPPPAAPQDLNTTVEGGGGAPMPPPPLQQQEAAAAPQPPPVDSEYEKFMSELN